MSGTNLERNADTGAADAAWMPLARQALWLAVQGDEPERVARLVERLAVEHGVNAIVEAMQAWIDTCLAYWPPPRDGEPVGLAFYDGDQLVGADDVSPDMAWSGRVIAARAAYDWPTFHALMAGVPDDAAWSRLVGVLLMTCAANIAHAHRASIQPQRWPDHADGASS